MVLQEFDLKTHTGMNVGGYKPNSKGQACIEKLFLLFKHSGRLTVKNDEERIV